MNSRTRKILSMVVDNTAPDIINSSPNHDSKKPKDCNPEEPNENCNSIEVEKDVEMVIKFTTKPEDTSNLNKTNVVAKTKSQIENIQPYKSLVPYYDSDNSSSSNYNDNLEQLKIIDTENQNKEQATQKSFSSCSSSSSSSTSSNRSSSNSDSDSSKSSRQGNPQLSITKNVTIDETDTDNDSIDNTPPQQLENNRNVKQLNRHPRKLKMSQNYYTSPVFTEGSDVDLSDTDPTFTTTESKGKRNYFFNQSSSSSSSSFNSSRPVLGKGRKRAKNPSKWKQNKIKCMRNKGKSYVSTSKTKKNVPARCLKEPCTEKCRLKCTTKIDMDNRYELFRKFWDLGDLAKQRAYISSSMNNIQPKYKYTNAEKPRHNNRAFHFIVNSTMIRVCKTFYKATLDISDRMIFTVQNKMNENDFSLTDLRGKHQSHRKIDPELRVAIKEHINSIPKIESHYVRSSTSRQFIDGSKTIKDLYIDFKLKQQENNKDVGTYITYYKIFTTEFNLAFFQPKKDQCDLCTSYYNSDVTQKKDIENKYQTHIEEKKYSRIEKLNDRNLVNKNVRVAVYDLEAVLQCPKGDTSSFYYKSKLNCYNLTVTELTPEKSKVAYNNVHCYFWTERDAKRGAVEIGSCIWAYLKALSNEGDDEKEVIFYSDNCCGQNKNKYIVSLYSHAVQTLKIKSITHKFLIRGHTQNEADSVHSLIEKEVKKNLKSGPIYTPDQYIALIKNAKKSKPPLIVHEMNFDAFYDLKILQEEWGYNYTTNSEGENVTWNEIKVLKITKENPTIFFYKTSFNHDSFKEVNVRNKRKKMKATIEITLQAAYSNRQEISANKKKDLQELVTKALIPSYYVGFYNSLF